MLDLWKTRGVAIPFLFPLKYFSEVRHRVDELIHLQISLNEKIYKPSYFLLALPPPHHFHPSKDSIILVIRTLDVGGWEKERVGEHTGPLDHPKCDMFVYNGRKNFYDHGKEFLLAWVGNRIGFSGRVLRISFHSISWTWFWTLNLSQGTKQVVLSGSVFRGSTYCKLLLELVIQQEVRT